MEQKNSSKSMSESDFVTPDTCVSVDLQGGKKVTIQCSADQADSIRTILENHVRDVHVIR